MIFLSVFQDGRLSGCINESPFRIALQVRVEEGVASFSEEIRSVYAFFMDRLREPDGCGQSSGSHELPQAHTN